MNLKSEMKERFAAISDILPSYAEILKGKCHDDFEHLLVWNCIGATTPSEIICDRYNSGYNDKDILETGKIILKEMEVL